MDIKKLLFISLLFLPLVADCQSIEETLSYINDKVRTYDWGTYAYKKSFRRESTKKAKEILENTKERYYKFAVSDNGKLTISRIKEEDKDNPTSQSSVFLKQLKDTVYLTTRITMEDYKSGISLHLKCKDQNLCIEKYTSANRLHSESTDRVSEIQITLYNRSICNRIANAITHLIKLGHQNDEFYEKDPFR